MNRKKLLIIYFSGTGNTRSVAEYMRKNMKKHCECDIFSTEKLPDDFDINHYKAAVIGFPTYHSQPAKPVMRWLSKVKTEKNIPVFLFTTCGLYSENSLRCFALEAVKHGLIPIKNSSYRCSATDGMLLAPNMEIWFRHENGLEERISSDCEDFMGLLQIHAPCRIPAEKWYSVLNAPNKLMGMNYRHRIYFDHNRCTGCGKCVRSCPEGALAMTESKFRIIFSQKCISCLRCVHHCPSKALSLYKNKPVEKVWQNTLDIS